MTVARKGRPNKYFTHIQPRLAEIEKLCAIKTEKQIAEEMGVAYSSWKEYKKLYPDLLAAIKKGRYSLVNELRGTLIKRAKGFQYEEKKVIKEDGVIVREEITIKTAMPDVAALNLCLKNYDKENWSNDPQMMDIRKKELELREKQIEANSW